MAEHKLRLSKTGRRSGQATLEFALSYAGVILPLTFGIIFTSQLLWIWHSVADFTRDGARYVAGKTSTTNGPGVAAMCTLVIADLKAITSSVSCPITPVNHAPPFVVGTDYVAPVAGQAVVAVYCGASNDCTGLPTRVTNSEVDVYVFYGFSDLNLLGGGITISGSSRAITSW